jgi:hypothetical protein
MKTSARNNKELLPSGSLSPGEGRRPGEAVALPGRQGIGVSLQSRRQGGPMRGETSAWATGNGGVPSGVQGEYGVDILLVLTGDRELECPA